MRAESLAGWGSVVMLLHGLLWWGGVLGCTALVVTSARSARRLRSGEPAPSAHAAQSPHDARVLALRRELAHAAHGSRTPATRPLDLPPPTTQRPATAGTDLLVLAAGCSAAAGGVHLAMAPLHTAEGPLHVGFFVVVGLLQGVQAARLLLRPTRSLLHAVLWLDLAVLLTWLTSRTVGLLGSTEPVGSWDLAANAWGAVCVVAAVRLLRTPATPRRPSPDPAAWSPTVLAALGVSVLALVLLPIGGH